MIFLLVVAAVVTYCGGMKALAGFLVGTCVMCGVWMEADR